MTDESADKERRLKRAEPLQKALQARGADISLEEADRLARVLLDFIQRGLIAAADARDVTGQVADSPSSAPATTTPEAETRWG